MYATVPRSILLLSTCRLQKSFVKDITQNMLPLGKYCLIFAPDMITASLVHGYLLTIASIVAIHVPAFSNNCCESWNEGWSTYKS